MCYGQKGTTTLSKFYMKHFVLKKILLQTDKYFRVYQTI